uniref:Uncharacterized protein n=1 Tax=Salmonella sp. TaxID=599 RepID=A0A482ETA5_SALSP|nr:hypothetical protein NNIBIDOC_00007 [Salmonella sp.]
MLIFLVISHLILRDTPLMNITIAHRCTVRKCILRIPSFIQNHNRKSSSIPDRSTFEDALWAVLTNGLVDDANLASKESEHDSIAERNASAD